MSDSDPSRNGDDPPTPDADDRWSQYRQQLIRLGQTSVGERILIAVSALLLSIVVGTVIVTVAGLLATCRSPVLTFGSTTLCYDPFYVFNRLFLGALGDPFAGGWSPLNAQFAATLRETTILVFTGLSVALAFRAGIFNIGTQGQLIIGALAAALTVLWAGSLVSGTIALVLFIPLGLLAGAIGGGLYGAIPGALKAYADANEVITTIMLNFVAVRVTLYLVRNHFADPTSQATQTRTLPVEGQFPSILFDPRTDFSLLALLIALAFVWGVYYLLEHTAFGYDLRTAGIQPAAAEYGGVDSARTILTSLTLSGALGGIGGAVFVMMTLGKFQTGIPSYGFDGITVSILAGNNPIGAVFAALLFGVLKSGSNVVAFATDVPPQLVGVLRGLIILFVAMPEFFRIIGRRLATREPDSPATATAGGGADD
ncbi:ABC transporter permease [Haloarcula sp. Atlit-7R]|uniref:ABC transporter permease n=1 Tax=Haloarcula sp. Atlit-7R TaxID=2282125 RepID=UPI000EF16538|nr:ABC transporter permease [Haloarcula sp. Atlit-7R]RLM96500.1 ABC transporter permease [Haloarcula sp. Atlit-7R]